MFGTSGIRGRVGETVTAGLALDVGRALASAGYDRVVVGRDPRESGRFLVDALTAGLRECGAEVVRLGLASTPTVARSVGWLDADAGVSVTASHNPPEDNGLKLWNPSGQAFTADQRDEIARRLDEAAFDLAAWDAVGDQSTWDGATDRHREALVEAADLADSLSVAVDVGNGAGRVTADALADLGCDVTTLNGQPDGSFPGRPSEPTAETCADLRAFVAASDADLGVAHDGDADRMMAVTGDGAFVPGDVLLALFARHAVGDGERVAVPLNTSLVVDDVVAAEGGSVTRTRVGDVHVADAAADPDVAFGGEPSGAWIWPDETRCPDGPLAAMRLAELVSHEGALADLVADVGSYPIRRESVAVDDKTGVMERVTARVADEYDDVQTVDGVRVDLGDAWFLVRASGTQPLVRVTAEARDPTRADEVFERARALVADQVAAG
ncbi:phosphoglucosamine mutase [Halobacteriaceae archaeon GCM10025711]